VRPVAYSIKSANHGSYHLLKWVLEGSNDGSSWTGLNGQDTRDLDANYATKTFTCLGRQFPRFVRLRQTGKTNGGHDNLCLSELELFGALGEGA